MTLYVSDLDGTLLTSSKKMKPRAVEMLNDLIHAGGMITYCTARSASSATVLMKDVDFQIPVILMNGVFIFDTIKKEYIVKNVFGREQQELLKNAVIRLGEKPMIHSFIKGEMKNSYFEDTESLKEYINDRKNDNRMRPVKSYDDMFTGEVFYAVFINPNNKNKLDEVFTAENGFSHTYYKDTYHDDEYWYEVFSSSASKANAVLQLKELVGADEAVCFGDNGNDLSMFSIADRSYAVENAIDEVKAAADGIIASNDSLGVPCFLERELFEIFDYKRPEKNDIDNERFSLSVDKALQRERSTIGTLNEKTVHNALKSYYCEDNGQEAKIGSFYADGVGENGIYEIQTAAFSKLNRKLSCMLRASHVTVIYPYDKIVHNYSINEQSGEIISETTRRNSSFSKFFLELYRIKAYLTNPNLTICLALLEVDRKLYYKDSRRIRRKGMKKETIPVRYIKEIRLDEPADYLEFLPESLPETFTRKEFSAFCRPTDASLMLEILEYVGVVERFGKKGNAVIYRLKAPHGLGDDQRKCKENI